MNGPSGVDMSVVGIYLMLSIRLSYGMLACRYYEPDPY